MKFPVMIILKDDGKVDIRPLCNAVGKTLAKFHWEYYGASSCTDHERQVIWLIWIDGNRNDFNWMRNTLIADANLYKTEIRIMVGAMERLGGET
jgi:hypothetical protein